VIFLHLKSELIDWVEQIDNVGKCSIYSIIHTLFVKNHVSRIDRIDLRFIGLIHFDIDFHMDKHQNPLN